LPSHSYPLSLHDALPISLLVLGSSYRQPVVRIQTIAEQQNIPKRFLEQILSDLKSAGVLESKRGIAGGYRLAKPPHKITLAEVIDRKSTRLNSSHLGISY